MIYLAVFFSSMEQVTVSNWKGSKTTSGLVRRQILKRWGEDEAKNYNPKSNCLTYASWLEQGFQVKKGEKAIKSFIIIEKKDKEGVIVGTYPKPINLFYIKQVQQLERGS